MKKKIDFGDLKGYILPVVVGLITIVTGINDKMTQNRNMELEQKLDALNKKLEEKEEEV